MGKVKQKPKRSPQMALLAMHKQSALHTYLIQAVFLLAARDMFDLGHGRLMKFYSRAKLYFESINDGTVTLNDLLLTLQDEVDIAVGPSGLKSIRGQRPPVTKEGVVLFHEGDETDDSREYDTSEIAFKSDKLRDKIGTPTRHTRL